MNDVVVCKWCAEEINAKALVCRFCNRGVGDGYVPESPKLSGLAVTAFVTTWFFPILGLILGIVSLASFRKSGNQVRGKGLAISSIWISTCFLIAMSCIAIWYVQVQADDQAIRDGIREACLYSLNC